jgi:hypothetical protein
VDELLLDRLAHVAALAAGDDRLLQVDEVLALSGRPGGDVLGQHPDDRVRVEARLGAPAQDAPHHGIGLADGRVALERHPLEVLESKEPSGRIGGPRRLCEPAAREPGHSQDESYCEGSQRDMASHVSPPRT